MTQPELDTQVAEAMRLGRHLIRLKERLRAIIPEDIDTLREQLALSSLTGGASNDDYELLYQVGSLMNPPGRSVTMGEFSRALGVPNATGTRIVDWLVGNGYAERLADPGDRRVVRLILTDEGHRVYRTITSFTRARLKSRLLRLTSDERVCLLYMMHRLIQVLEAEL